MMATLTGMTTSITSSCQEEGLEQQRGVSDKKANLFCGLVDKPNTFGNDMLNVYCPLYTIVDGLSLDDIWSVTQFVLKFL